MKSKTCIFYFHITYNVTLICSHLLRRSGYVQIILEEDLPWPNKTSQCFSLGKATEDGPTRSPWSTSRGPAQQQAQPHGSSPAAPQDNFLGNLWFGLVFEHLSQAIPAVVISSVLAARCWQVSPRAVPHEAAQPHERKNTDRFPRFTRSSSFLQQGFWEADETGSHPAQKGQIYLISLILAFSIQYF